MEFCWKKKRLILLGVNLSSNLKNYFCPLCMKPVKEGILHGINPTNNNI